MMAAFGHILLESPPLHHSYLDFTNTTTQFLHIKYNDVRVLPMKRQRNMFHGFLMSLCNLLSEHFNTYALTVSENER